MITLPDGTQLRNLEEQVQKNKDDIARHYEADRVLLDWGITIVGTVASPEDLPPYSEGVQFGFAYAVGAEEPYSYYIWTRTSEDTAVEDGEWFNIGKLAIQGERGPQGAQGPVGPIGIRGSFWYVGEGVPSTIRNENDMYLDSVTANVWQIKTVAGLLKWTLIGNIKGAQGLQGAQGPQGPQGAQGPQGEKGNTGDVGGLVTINAILESTSQLPLPTELQDLTKAYLIGTSQPYDLYVQIGSSSAEAVWTNTGPFNASTLVTVNGQAQNVWSADGKVDKLTGQKVYITGGGLDWSNQAVPDTFPVRDGNGEILVQNPTQQLSAVNLTYLNAQLAKKPNTLSVDATHHKLYDQAPNQSTASPNGLIIGDGLEVTDGMLQVTQSHTPKYIHHITIKRNKSYENDEIVGFSATIATTRETPYTSITQLCADIVPDFNHDAIAIMIHEGDYYFGNSFIRRVDENRIILGYSISTPGGIGYGGSTIIIGWGGGAIYKDGNIMFADNNLESLVDTVI